MSKFKSGDEVFYGGNKYIYLCEHPRVHGRSVIQRFHHTGQLRGFQIVKTSNLYAKIKTHIVNDFEVPAPITEEEFNDLDGDDCVFLLSALYANGVYIANKDSTCNIGIKLGLAFKTESDLKQNILAIQGIDPNQNN